MAILKENVKVNVADGMKQTISQIKYNLCYQSECTWLQACILDPENDGRKSIGKYDGFSLKLCEPLLLWTLFYVVGNCISTG